IPRDPFKFGNGPHASSTYQVEMVIDGVRYAYRLEVDDAAVLFEGLYSYPERRRRVLFEREGSDIRFRRGLGALSGTRELLTGTTLALSAAMRFDEPEVQHFARSLAGIGVLGVRRRAPWRRPFGAGMPGVSGTGRLFDDQGTSLQSSLFDDPDIVQPSPRESALALLRFADLGIDDVQIVDDDIDESQATPQARREPRRQLRFIHRVLGQELPFDLDEESAGTQTWFALIGPTLSALRSGRILLFDEIDASLHPRLSARLLELFQDPETNPHGAQLIFTTHDTSLLRQPRKTIPIFCEGERAEPEYLDALKPVNHGCGTSRQSIFGWRPGTEGRCPRSSSRWRLMHAGRLSMKTVRSTSSGACSTSNGLGTTPVCKESMRLPTCRSPVTRQDGLKSSTSDTGDTVRPSPTSLRPLECIGSLRPSSTVAPLDRRGESPP
ncbi:MAG: AAA family ATPase, partial [Acidimicrobiales bacterium]